MTARATIGRELSKLFKDNQIPISDEDFCTLHEWLLERIQAWKVLPPEKKRERKLHFGGVIEGGK